MAYSDQSGPTGMHLQRFRYDERPDLVSRLEQEETGAFPRFLLQDEVWDWCWPHLLDEFGSLQYVVYDPDRDAVVGGSNAVPLRWDGTLPDLPAGVHAAMLRGIEEHARGVKPNTACGVQTIVAQKARGQGLSTVFLRNAKQRAAEHGLEHAITPLRPSLKHRYPDVSLAEYLDWRRPDGAPFDPWLRVWLRAGAEILTICQRSLVIEGTVREWETWTETEFPGSGRYLIPGGQVPVEIDRESDRGEYAEPHVWLRLPLVG